MIILYIIGSFVFGFLFGAIMMSILSASSKEAAVNDAFKMGYEMAKIEHETIDVTELVGSDDN